MEPAEFDQLIDPGLVRLEGVPGTKQETIEFMLDIIDEAGRVTDHDQVLEDLLAREAETTTGVGKEIAIPHAKTSGVDRPTVAFARSDDGVDFGAMDGKPARLIFMLVFPEGSDRNYLKMLSKISRALMHEEVRQVLLEAEDAETVVSELHEAVLE